MKTSSYVIACDSLEEYEFSEDVCLARLRATSAVAAHREARAQGWELGVRDLCPECCAQERTAD